MSVFQKFWLKAGIDLLTLDTLNPGKMEAGLALEQMGALTRMGAFQDLMSKIGTGFNCIHSNSASAYIENGGYDYDVLALDNVEEDASHFFTTPEPMYDLDNENTKTVSLAVSGLDGLDTGTEAVSTLYYLYAIANSSYPGVIHGIWSVESEVGDVTLPTGYDQVVPISFAYNDSGSDFEPFQTYPTHTDGGRRYVYLNAPSILAAGESATYVEIVKASAKVPDWKINGVWINIYTSDGTSVFTFNNNSWSDGLFSTISVREPMVFVPSDDGSVHYKRTSGQGTVAVELVAIDYVTVDVD